MEIGKNDKTVRRPNINTGFPELLSKQIVALERAFPTDSPAFIRRIYAYKKKLRFIIFRTNRDRLAGVDVKTNDGIA